MEILVPDFTVYSKINAQTLNKLTLKRTKYKIMRSISFYRLNICSLLFANMLIVQSALSASGLFPKMPAANQIYVVDCRGAA